MMMSSGLAGDVVIRMPSVDDRFQGLGGQRYTQSHTGLTRVKQKRETATIGEIAAERRSQNGLLLRRRGSAYASSCGMLQLSPDPIATASFLGKIGPNSSLGLACLLCLFGKVGRASKPTQSAFEYSLATSVSARSSFISIHSKNGHQLRQQLLRPHLGDHPYVLPRLLRKNCIRKEVDWM